MSAPIADVIFYNIKYSQRGLTNYHLQTLYSYFLVYNWFPSLEVPNCPGKQDMVTVLQQYFKNSTINGKMTD